MTSEENPRCQLEPSTGRVIWISLGGACHCTWGGARLCAIGRESAGPKSGTRVVRQIGTKRPRKARTLTIVDVPARILATKPMGGPEPAMKNSAGPVWEHHTRLRLLPANGARIRALSARLLPKFRKIPAPDFGSDTGDPVVACGASPKQTPPMHPRYHVRSLLSLPAQTVWLSVCPGNTSAATVSNISQTLVILAQHDLRCGLIPVDSRSFCVRRVRGTPQSPHARCTRLAFSNMSRPRGRTVRCVRCETHKAKIASMFCQMFLSWATDCHGSSLPPRCSVCFGIGSSKRRLPNHGAGIFPRRWRPASGVVWRRPLMVFRHQALRHDATMARHRPGSLCPSCANWPAHLNHTVASAASHQRTTACDHTTSDHLAVRLA